MGSNARARSGRKRRRAPLCRRSPQGPEHEFVWLANSTKLGGRLLKFFLVHALIWFKLPNFGLSGQVAIQGRHREKFSQTPSELRGIGQPDKLMFWSLWTAAAKRSATPLSPR